jgi:hypothetical protein
VVSNSYDKNQFAVDVDLAIPNSYSYFHLFHHLEKSFLNL